MSERGRRRARVVGLFLLALAVVGLARLGSLVDAAKLLTVATGGAALAWGISVLDTRWLKRPASIRAHIFISTASGAIATATGGWLIARWLFDWEEEIPVLAAVVFLGVGAKAMLASVSLSKQLEQATGSLVVAAKRLAPDDPAGVNVEERSLEVRELARQVDVLSERLEEVRARERGLEKSRRELVAGVSHDLRTPLAAMNALAAALEDGLVTDEAEVARYHRTILREVERVSQLVDDLFELSRIEAGALQLQLERVAVGELISDALAQAAPLAQQKDIRLEGRFLERLPQVRLSEPHILRVLTNLLDNALHHTPAGGQVSLEASVVDDAVWVAVMDECGGLADDDLPHLFEPGFRGQSADDASRGSGLGLAIARGLVESHGGAISAGNKDGGCRFTLSLPVDGPSQQQTGRTDPAAG